jgi:uncharacterized membrane protein
MVCAIPRSIARTGVAPDHPGRVIRSHPELKQAPRLHDRQEGARMSNLIAIAYPDLTTARNVAAELGQLTKEQSIVLDDIVVIEKRPDGKVKLHQAVGTAGAGAAGGALWGGLIGLIFLAPLLGMAVGAAAGGAAGALTDVGVDDKFMKDLGETLQDNGAALVVLVRQSTPDKVLPRISQYGGEVIQSSLDDETEARLQAALGGQPAAV